MSENAASLASSTLNECQLLASIPGIGPIVATAPLGSAPDPTQFKNGRQFAAWVGLTPKQRSSGGKAMLGGITKHGDTYRRMMLVQGARAVLRFLARRDDRPLVKASASASS